MRKLQNYLLLITASIVLLWMPSTANATVCPTSSPIGEDENTQSLVVWLKDGSQVRFALDTNPRTKFFPDRGRIRIQYSLYGGNDYYWLEMADVLRYTYEGIATSVPTLKGTTEQMLVNFENNTLVLHRLREGAMIQIYASDGRMVSSHRALGTSALHLSFAGYPSGMYIVKAQQQTFKIIKR